MMTTELLAASDPDYADRLINEQEAANFLGFSVRALQNWRLRGGGPEYVRVSRRSVRYRRRDLIAWADDRLEAHTSRARDDPVGRSSEGTARRAQSAEREQQAANTVEARQVEPASEERVKSPFDVFTDWAR